MAAETTNNLPELDDKKLRFAVMRVDHLEQVLNIEQKSFPTPWSYQSFYFELTENDFAFYVVALANGIVAGYAGMWLVLDESHITNVAVHPDYRGCGLGRAIMNDLLARAVVLGAARITLEVRVSNKTARGLYKSLGFVEKGFRRKYYSDNNEDAIIMWLYFK